VTSWMDWEISDDEGSNPFGVPGEFEFNVEYDFDPGDPGCQYDSNGDGYPPYPPNVTLSHAVCKRMTLENLGQKVPTQEEVAKLTDWFWTVLDKRPGIRDQMEEFGVEQMAFEPDDDGRYD